MWCSIVGGDCLVPLLALSTWGVKLLGQTQSHAVLLLLMERRLLLVGTPGRWRVVKLRNRTAVEKREQWEVEGPVYYSDDARS